MEIDKTAGKIRWESSACMQCSSGVQASDIDLSVRKSERSGVFVHIFKPSPIFFTEK